MRRPRTTVRRVAAPAITLAVLGTTTLSGCGLFGGDRPGDATTTTTPHERVTTSTTIPAPTIEVLDAGAQPRRPIRLTFTPGAVTKVVVTTRIQVSQRSGTSSAKLRAPAVRETVAFTVEAVADGMASVSFAFEAVGVVQGGTDLTDAEVAELDERLQALTRLEGSGTVDDRGRLTDLRYQVPSDLDPAARQTIREAQDQLADLSVPLPEEAVGVGARWRTTDTATLAGTTLTQETTYEATGLAATELAYTSTVVQTGAPQQLTEAGLPSGTRARLISARLTGTAAGSLHLGSIAPTAHAEISGSQVIDTTTADRTTRLTQDVGIVTDIVPAS